jgi:hypothetical protein
MRIHLRLLPLLVAATVLLVACGGDDSKATQESSANATATTGQSSGSASGGSIGSSSAATPAPADSRRMLQVDCGQDLKAFRFNGRLALKAPQSGTNSSDFSSIIGSLLQDVKFSGAFVAPDRSQLKLEGGKDSALGAIEFLQIGSTSYTRFGSAAWQQSSIGGSPTDFLQELDPREICTQVEQNLRADVPSKKEKVNGVDAVRYDYDRSTLQQLGSGFLGAAGGPDDQLPENVKLSVWVSEKEKFPVKMQMSASGQADGQNYAMEMEVNVTDLNGNVRIDAPR